MYNWDADAVNNETSHIPRPSYNEQGARVETARGTRRAPTSPRRLADARRSERKRAARLCRSRLHAHPSRRPPPERQEPVGGVFRPRPRDAHSRLIDELYRTFAELSPPPPPPLRMLFRLEGPREGQGNVDGERRKRSRRIRLHARSFVPSYEYT